MLKLQESMKIRFEIFTIFKFGNSERYVRASTKPFTNKSFFKFQKTQKSLSGSCAC